MAGISRQTILNFFAEFGPVLAFTFSFHYLGFFGATGLLIGLTIVSMLYSYLSQKEIFIFPLFTGAMVIVFGLSTILLHNPRYIIQEYTFYNGIFCFYILYGLLKNRLVLKDMFEKLFAISDRGWRIASYQWMFFTFAVAVGNELVWLLGGVRMWIHFRAIVVPIELIFTLLQLPIAKNERLPEATAWGFRK